MRAALAVLLVVAGSGCFGRAIDRCPGCVLVTSRTPSLPPARPGSRVLLVLVGGALGFGPEWKAVVAALREAPALEGGRKRESEVTAGRIEAGPIP